MPLIDDGPIRITDFSPNCLMGTSEAIARNRLGVESFDRLFFNHSFVYDRHPDGLGFDVPPVLNSSFSRALPLSKQEFLGRLEWCYGVCLHHKAYTEFKSLKSDLDCLAAACLPVISEIDFHVMQGHPFFGRRHEAHMMIVCGFGAQPGTYAVVDAVFGQSDFPIRALATCFEERRTRGRPFYLMHVRRDGPADRHLPREKVLVDLKASLANLTSTSPDRGLGALAAFVADFAAWVATGPAPFLVPGFWAFMCNARNNMRFLAALDPELRNPAAPSIAALEQQFGWLYKRWFLLNLRMENAAAAHAGTTDAVLQGLPHDLAVLAERESRTPDLIAAVIRGLEAA